MTSYRKKTVILAVSVLFILLLHPRAHALHRNNLEVDIDISKSQITGISSTAVLAGQEHIYRKGPLEIVSIKLFGRTVNYEEREGFIFVTPDVDGLLEIQYRGVYRDSGVEDNVNHGVTHDVIDERGVSLTGTWYPAMEVLNYYDLTVTLPEGYEAVSEAEDIKKERKGGRVHYQFRFPYPVDGINLVASDKYVIVKDEFRDIELYAYFFPDDLELAKTYIEHTKKYLGMYEDLVGMYPFKRFSIVENFLPTGYSMPTFTLLGSTVVKLPFIVETSLGHEILHQWFGNSVYIDYNSGNWAEGLTTYLADHLYREQKGEGWKYRKQILIDYRSYVDEGGDVPLKYFTGRVDRPSRALGYGKVAMIFHMLKNRVGKKTFYESLKYLIENNRFKRASWNDIRVAFEKQYGQDLEWFFTQWTEKEGLLELSFYGFELSQSGREFDLHFHIDQSDNVFKVKLPVTLYFKDRVSFDSLSIDDRENSFYLTLSDKPHKIVLDEDYEVARGLHKNEIPPVIARLLGDDNIIIAVPTGGEEVYGTIIDEFERKGAVAKAVHDIKIPDIEANSLVILGIDNPLIRRLCGSIAEEDAGFSVIMKDNPWNREKVLAVLHGRSKEEIDAAFRKIPHYGKYSKLTFTKGVNTGKEIQKTKRGIVMNLEHEASAIEVSSIKTLSDVIRGVQDKKIIYVGEVHDVFAHHAVQLDVITGLYKKNPKIAIGMEMFQRPFQETLDSFVDGKIGEENFLKESEYFKRWGFDYMLYKPILDFARTEKIPVIALNLQREIIEKVSRGGIDSLSDEEKGEIPAELDFSDNEYRERLKEIFSMHKNSDKKDFNHFVQSQILWDETMSNSVADFLKKNPDHKIVVLAGQGHLRYGSGIPKRTYRRNGLDYAIVLIDDKVEQDIADYVIFPKPVEGITTPKLMVFLREEEGRFEIAGFPEDSVSEKAGLKSGDVILFLDEVEVKSIDDIKIYLLYKKTGETVKVKILRMEEEREKEMVFDVVL